MRNILRSAEVDHWDDGLVEQRSEPYRQPRILFFAPKECWPPDTGAKLRNYYLARDLAQEAEVTYLSFDDSSCQAIIQRESDGSAGRNSHSASRRVADTGFEVPAALFHRTVIVRRPARYKLSNIVRGAVGRIPLTVLNYTTREMTGALSRLLSQNDYDIVQMESIHLAGYLPLLRSARSKPKVICDWHNIESELMWRYSQRERRGARRLYAKATARRMRELEASAIPQFDANLAVSQRDADTLAEMGFSESIFVLKNGVDLGRMTDTVSEQLGRSTNGTVRNRLVYVGSMDYHANEDAAVHFTREMWPALHQVCPQLRFTIVGRNPGPTVKALERIPGIEVTGTVADVRPYYREAVAAVVPLRVGGGSRLKILEAMAAGVPVISTALGAEGLAVEDGCNILLAETGADFQRAVRALSDKAKWATLSREGRHLVSDHYEWSSIGSKLRQIHAGLLARRKTEFSRGVWADAGSGGFGRLADLEVSTRLGRVGGIK
ncbi:MAG TPA: glycosyltransferase [Blastocatellia bacterium]